MENPINVDDLGVPLFSETPIYATMQSSKHFFQPLQSSFFFHPRQSHLFFKAIYGGY